MKSRFQKGVVSTPAPKKAPKNFIYVNLPADEQKELRALAREIGTELRTCIHQAVGSARRRLIERVKLARRTGLNSYALASLLSGTPRN